MIRFAEREDIPAIMELDSRVFVDSPMTQRNFETVFFDNPWFDPEIRSIMCEKDGKIVGFIGVVARPMELGDRPVRGAVPTRFMADPQRGGGLVAIQMLKALAAMPFDLAVNDNSNNLTYDVWMRAGAEIFVTSSLRWTRSFQPAAGLRWRLSQRADVLGRMAGWAKPAVWACDALMARAGWNDFADPGGLEAHATLDPSRLLPLIRAECSKRAFRPVCDESAFRWQLGELERMGRYRQLRGAVVQDKRGRDVGWYLYYEHPGVEAKLLQFGALPRQEEAVFALLLAEAHERGVISITGRSNVRLLRALATERCEIVTGHPWSLILSKDKELTSVLQSGDAFFTGLEGEWW